MKFLAHSTSLEMLFKQLASSADGLTSQQAIEKLASVGHNIIEREKGTPLWKMFANQFKSLLVWVLITAGIISLLTGHLVDVYVIGVVILVNMSIGIFHEYKADKVINGLQSSVKQICTVIRDGQFKSLNAEELVPGDVVELRAGDKVPADLRLLEAYSLSAIESSLTGESKAVDKTTAKLADKTPLGERKNMLYLGTLVLNGEAKGLVIATGKNTQLGLIATQIKEIKEEKSLFHERTNKLTKQMVAIAVSTTIITFAIGWWRGFALSELFMFTLAALVSGIPEGLPAVLTIVLSIASYRMGKRKAVLRNLPSIETLSTVTAIVTDKTGTLTQNTMNVKKLILANLDILEISGEGWQPKGNFYCQDKKVDPQNNQQLMTLLRRLTISSKARLENDNGQYQINGDPTEGSRTVLASKAGIDQLAELKNYQIIDELPYDQVSKYRSLLVKELNSQKKLIIIVGASETVLACCNKLDVQTSNNVLTPEKKQFFTDQISALADQAMRMQALAFKEVNNIRSLSQAKFTNFTLSAILGIQDPVRKDVKQAITKAKKAGIRVIMATGDYKNTALAIAKEVGLVDKHHNNKYPLAMSEEELVKLNDTEFIDCVKHVSVFARLTPLMKLRIGQALQKSGEIIAMTGDGVNDAPVLKKANIGIAMGKIGTDAAREASDLILTDDNFTSIVNAVEEGRTVFINIRQTSLYLITTNIAESLVIISSLIFGMQLPLLPIQLLWLNLVTDGASDIALATELPHQCTLQEKPRQASEGIITKKNFKFIIFNVLVMTALSLFTFGFFYYDDNLAKARTAVFAILAFAQIFNTFNMRSINESIFKIGPTTNKYVLVNFFVSSILIVLAIETSFIANIFRFVSLSVVELGAIFVLASLVLVMGEVYKLVQGKRQSYA